MTLEKTFFAVRKIPEKKITSIKKLHAIIKNINQYNLYGRQLLPFCVCAFTSSKAKTRNEITFKFKPAHAVIAIKHFI